MSAPRYTCHKDGNHVRLVKMYFNDINGGFWSENSSFFMTATHPLLANSPSEAIRLFLRDASKRINELTNEMREVYQLLSDMKGGDISG
jgi:hypothetical protein